MSTHTDAEKILCCRRELGTEAAVKAAGKYHMKGKVRFGQETVKICLCLWVSSKYHVKGKVRSDQRNGADFDPDSVSGAWLPLD